MEASLRIEVLLSDEQWQPAEPLLCGKSLAISCRYRLGAVPPVRSESSRIARASPAL